MAIIKPNNNTISAITALPAAISTGKVLQVSTVNYAGDVNTTSTSYVQVDSNFEVSLTPSATSSKILIMMGNGNAYINSNREMKIQMYRKIGSGSLTAMTGNDVEGTSSDIGYVMRAISGSGQMQIPHSFNLLDSPNTTSAVTYSPYYRSNNGDAVYFSTPDGNPWLISLTIMEIGA